MSDPEAAVPTAMPPDELFALVQKLRAAQRHPSTTRQFRDGEVKKACEALEDAVDRELARRAGGEETT